MSEEKQSNMPSTFDRLIGGLEGLPDVVHTKPATIRTTLPLLGSAQTFIVQTFRQYEQGDTIFLEYVDGNGSFRLAIPPKVAEVIARQREALVTKNRKKAAKAAALDRKERGMVPGFMLKKEGKRENRSKRDRRAKVSSVEALERATA